jgi:hypothetical protein
MKLLAYSENHFINPLQRSYSAAAILTPRMHTELKQKP